MKIAYLTMSYDLKMTYSLAIPGVYSQAWSAGRKAHYLMYQKPFPPHIGDNHDLYMDIREYDVDGIAGFGWWLLKLKRFLEVCQEERFVWWDEDDYYSRGYTINAMEPIRNGAPLAWNLNNYEVKLGSIKQREYTSGMGTLVGRVDALRQPVAELLAKYPDGRLRIDENNNPVDCHYTGKWRYCGGALDAHLKKILIKQGVMTEHCGTRFMTFHSKTNTKGGRKSQENVDYAS